METQLTAGVCEFCKAPFERTILNNQAQNYQRFCGQSCSSKFHNRRRYGDRAFGAPNVPSGTVGAISELIVSADLLSKGYEVFRALSQNCSCDLAILRNGKLLRIEVRTGYKDLISGKVLTPKRSFRADILATVAGGQCYYAPPLP